MTDALEQISGLLHEAGETHHRVFRIVDGADDDWASWYAQWLIDLSELPALLGARPVRSELVYLLVSLDKQFPAEAPGEAWEIYCAGQILRHFQPSAGYQPADTDRPGHTSHAGQGEYPVMPQAGPVPRVRRETSSLPGLIVLVASRLYRQPRAGATWVRMLSMTWAL